MAATKVHTAAIYIDGKRVAEFERLTIKRDDITGVCRVTGTLKPGKPARKKRGGR